MDKYRLWYAIVYPSDAPSNWESIISDFNVPWVCSPLHRSHYASSSRDLLVPAHYHCCFMFPNPVSLPYAAYLTDAIGAPPPFFSRLSLSDFIQLSSFDSPDSSFLSYFRFFCGASLAYFT